MRFFSKLTFLLNVSFIIAVILRYAENAAKQAGNFDGAIRLQPLESTLVIMGYGAIFINLIFHIILGFRKLFKAQQNIAQWIIWFNFLLLLVQVYYFFILID
jgi:hypothetical protein